MYRDSGPAVMGAQINHCQGAETEGIEGTETPASKRLRAWRTDREGLGC